MLKLVQSTFATGRLTPAYGKNVLLFKDNTVIILGERNVMVRPVNDWRQIAHFIEHLTRDQGTLCSNPGFVCHYFPM